MNIAICSAFRDSATTLSRYFDRIAALTTFRPNDRIRVIAAEGDSRDSTRARLARGNVQIVDVAHGHRPFGSTEEPERLSVLSNVLNIALDAVREDDGVVVWVESDLLWEAPVLSRLVDQAVGREGGYDIWAPMVYAGDAFYDIWGFRDLAGERFGSLPPFHPRLGVAPMEISSAGSCLAMRGEVAREARALDGMALVGWCADARRKGYRIAVDPTLRINHP